MAYLIPSIRPSFDRRPDFVVGMPVALAIDLFAFVMPRARFQLNDSPGISFFRLAMRHASLDR